MTESTDYGVTDAGFVRKRTSDVVDAILNRLQQRLGIEKSLALSPVAYQEVAAVAAEIGEVWEAGEAIYNAFRRSAARGASLDHCGRLVGVPRLKARNSTVRLTCAGKKNTSVAAGALFQVKGSKITFASVAAVTLDDQGTGTVDCVATDAGPLEAPAGTVTEIVDRIDGLDSVVNMEDASVGRFVESDARYRLRIEDSTQAVGAATPEALRARIELENPEVTSCVIFENLSSSPTTAGQPPHSIHVVVSTPGTLTPTVKDGIGATIWRSKAAGIGTHCSDGTDTACVSLVPDTRGEVHTVRFDQAKPVPILVLVGIFLGPEVPWKPGKRQQFTITVTDATRPSYTITVNGHSVTLNVPPEVTLTPPAVAEWLRLKLVIYMTGMFGEQSEYAGGPDDPLFLGILTVSGATISFQGIIPGYSHTIVVSAGLEFKETQPADGRELEIARAVARALNEGARIGDDVSMFGIIKTVVNAFPDLTRCEAIMGWAARDFLSLGAGMSANNNGFPKPVAIAQNEIAEFSSNRVLVMTFPSMAAINS
jgi:hypothetical protein